MALSHCITTFCSIFMTIARYGHIKYKDSTLWIVILASWEIAFVEYCFQVPANRIGPYPFQRRTIENHPKSDYPSCVLRLFSAAHQQAFE